MTGSEHYAEAERLVGVNPSGLMPLPHAESIARAQVHAVLALAAAIGTSADVPDSQEWRKVAGSD